MSLARIRFGRLNVLADQGRHILGRINVLVDGKSAASFGFQVAARLPDMFCNFYLVKLLKTQQPLKLEKK